MDLTELRQKIDALDDSIRDAFLERMAICADIAAYKKENGLAVAHPGREREIVARLTKDMDADMATYFKIFYSGLFEVSRAYQTKKTADVGRLSDMIHKAMETTPATLPVTCTVACQGAEGAYSQLAAEKLFSIPSILHFGTFEGVFNAVAGGLCRYGVLPIDNNLHGSVTEVYDLMKKHKVYIVKSVKLRVDHSLVARPGATLSGIREIVSHPQALGQCRGFLDSLGKDVKITECASSACASLYGLVELQASVADSDNNHTRFIVISKTLEIYPGANKTSIMFTLPHTPGSLFSIISKFAALGVNFSKIESRPIRGKDFEYMFYLDFEGSLADEGLLKTLDLFDAEYPGGTFLGSYSES